MNELSVSPIGLLLCAQIYHKRCNVPEMKPCTREVHITPGQ